MMMMDAVRAWLGRRWAEPESRAAVGAAIAALMAWAVGQISARALGTAEAAAAITFALPGPVARQVLAEIAKDAPKAVPFVATVALAGTLAACASTQQPANPKVVADIQKACAVYQAAKLAAGVAAGLVPGGGSAIAIVEAAVDPVCADPTKYAADVATVRWVLHNASAIKAALAAKTPTAGPSINSLGRPHENRSNNRIC